MIVRFYKLWLDNLMVIEDLIGAIGMMVLADHNADHHLIVTQEIYLVLKTMN